MQEFSVTNSSHGTAFTGSQRVVFAVFHFYVVSDLLIFFLEHIHHSVMICLISMIFPFLTP